MKRVGVWGWAVVAGVSLAVGPAGARAESPGRHSDGSAAALAEVLEKLGRLESRLDRIEKQLAEAQAAREQPAPFSLAAAAECLLSHLVERLMAPERGDPNAR